MNTSAVLTLILFSFLSCTIAENTNLEDNSSERFNRGGNLRRRFDHDPFSGSTVGYGTSLESPTNIVNHDSKVDVLEAPTKTIVGRVRRRDQTSTTTVIIENDCRGALWLVVWYARNGYIYREGYIFLPGRGDSVSFPNVADSTIHVYAHSPGNYELHDLSSPYCMYSSHVCGKAIDLGSTNPSSVFLSLGCGTSTIAGTTGVAPTPAPIAPTPAPVPPKPAPFQSTTFSSTSAQWLAAHNRRRQQFHQKYGKTYIPLEWSNSVAASAQNYADLLIGRSGCQIAHGYQGDSYGGENLAANWGSSQHAATPEQVLTRWFDNEENLPALGAKMHFTQVGWRGTKYVGCGQATKVFDNGNQFCAIQVCRYIAPGNCNINENNYLQKTLEDNSPCGPQCPIDAAGC